MSQCCEHCSKANEDHDLLIRIDGKLDTLKDHETRLRKVEKWGFMAIGGLFVLQIIMGVLLTWKVGR